VSLPATTRDDLAALAEERHRPSVARADDEPPLAAGAEVHFARGHRAVRAPPAPHVHRLGVRLEDRRRGASNTRENSISRFDFRVTVIAPTRRLTGGEL